MIIDLNTFRKIKNNARVIELMFEYLETHGENELVEYIMQIETMLLEYMEKEHENNIIEK